LGQKSAGKGKQQITALLGTVAEELTPTLVEEDAAFQNT
jgi:hypothetical protein